MPYKVLSHTADTGIEATAPTLAGLIDELASGMFELMSPTDPCPSTGRVEIEVTASSPENLVVDALSELLYESETRDMILCGFKTSLPEANLVRVRATGVPLQELETCGPPIKAVTYHDIVAEDRGDHWFGRVYFDV